MLKRLLGPIAAALAFCAAAAPVRAGEPITIFAAASLKTALEDVAARYETATGDKLTLVFAGTPALAKQIQEGAPADLFFSANTGWMDKMTAAGLVDPGSVVNLLGNSIVLIAPKDSTTAVTIAPGFDLAAALGDGRLAIADPVAVPAGQYGKAALDHLGAWDGVADKLAPAQDVRGALAFVATGEAPLGIVYATDAHAEPRVRIVGAFPADSHPAIIYPLGRVAASTNPDTAKVLTFLASDVARAAFQAQGFTVQATPPTQ